MEFVASAEGVEEDGAAGSLGTCSGCWTSAPAAAVLQGACVRVCMCACVRVCVVPVFGGQRRQLSPWHHFLIGTVDHEPSTHWTASPDTRLDPVETEQCYCHHTYTETRHVQNYICRII